MLSYWSNGYSLTIVGFPNDGTVFLQGDDAAALEDELEAAETGEIEQRILDQYSELAEQEGGE